MRYCPKCQTLEQAGDSPACAACGAVLEAMDKLTEEDLDRPVVLTWCKDMIEGEVLKAALGGIGIYAIVENEALMSCFNGYDLRGAAADTRVLVRVRDAETALEFLRRKQAGELAIGEDDLPDESSGNDQ